MAIREIVFTVSEDRLSLSPSTVQDGGVQGEHNATRVIFRFGKDSVWNHPEHKIYIECEDNAGNVDPSELLEVNEGQVSVLLPLAWTQYGGISTLRLTAENADGDKFFAPDAALRFSSRQNASQKVDGLLKTRMMPMLQAVSAVEEAVHTAENAATGAVTAKNDAAAARDVAVDAAIAAVPAPSRAEAAAQRAEAAAGAGGGGGMTVIDDGNGVVRFVTAAAPDVHQHAYTATVTKQPTCGATGVRTYTCTCGHSYTETIPATGNHVYDGDDDTVCNVCGHVRDVACDHEYNAVVTAPTCTSGGYTTHTCTKCGDTYVDEYTDALGHTYDDDSDAVCNVCGHVRADANDNHVVTLKGVAIGTPLTVSDTNAEKVFCYDGGNLFPMTELETTGDGRLTVNEDGSIDIKHWATITLPFALPPGYYTISADITEFAADGSYPGVYYKHDDTSNGSGNMSNNWVAQGGRPGCVAYVPQPLTAIQIFSAANNSASGGSLANGLTSTFKNICLWYSPEKLVGSADHYDYKGDYCGRVYDLANETPTVTTDPLVMFADDFASFTVTCGGEEGANATPAAFMLRRSAAPASASDYEDAGPLTAMVVAGRGYTSFPDKEARADILALKGQPEQPLADYLVAEADRVNEEVIGMGSEADLTFLAFADPHSFEEYKYRKYAKLMENPGIDFVLGLGDINPYNDFNTKADCLDGMHQMIKAVGRGANCFYVAGNHDVVIGSGGATAERTYTKKEQHELLCSHLKGAVRFDKADPYGCHYYVDFDDSKIRLIVLNTSDVIDAAGNIRNPNTVGMDQIQMDWFLGTALDFTGKTGWSVMVCCHTKKFDKKWELDEATGKYSWVDNPSLLHQIMNAVKKKEDINIDSPKIDLAGNKWALHIERDFAGTDVEVIGIFEGHGHHDSHKKEHEVYGIQFRSDNAYVDDVYIADLAMDEVAVGYYYFEAKNGRRFAFEITQSNVESMAQNGVSAKFQYNEYLSKNNTMEYWLLDANGKEVRFNFAYNSNYTKWVGEGKNLVEIALKSDFVARRNEEDPITLESCAIVNINKADRKITVVPYGLSDAREIFY